MTSDPKTLLTGDMFLVDVRDDATGESYKTLSITRTPTMMMSFAANKFTESSAKFFKDRYGLGTVDWRMLLLLAHMPGVTAVQAARTLGVDQGTVSRCVQRLSNMDMIVAGDLHANGRSRGLFLSDAGRGVHDQVLSSALSRIKRLLKDFDTKDVEVFCTFLLRFNSSLEAQIEFDNQEL